MKKLIALLLALLTALTALTALPALASDSGYRFTVDGLGVAFALDENWMDAVDAGQLSVWARTDADAAKGDFYGYALFYLTPDLTAFKPKTYPEGEKWLDERAVLLGGVAAAKTADADLSAVRPDLQKKALGQAGNTYFTLMRPERAPEYEGDETLSAVGRSVYTALTDEGRFILSDAGADYGILGAFDTVDLLGESVNNDYIAGAALTVVNFWSTTCGPCISELPALAALSEAYEDQGVRFLGIVLDAADERAAQTAADLLESAGVTFPNIPPDVSNKALRRVQYTPTTIFLNANGKTVGEAVVGGQSEAEWNKTIKNRLKMAK